MSRTGGRTVNARGTDDGLHKPNRFAESSFLAVPKQREGASHVMRGDTYTPIPWTPHTVIAAW